MLDRVRQTGLSDELLSEVEFRLRRQRTKRRIVAKTVLSAAAFAMLLLWGIPYLTQTATVVNPSGRSETVTLSDGSSVELNGRAEIKTDFRYGKRSVRLVRGEAYFAVTKDPAHPFLVATPQGTIRVTGTHFDVHVVRDGHAEVTLVEGAVTVELPGSEAAHLAPGQRLMFGPSLRDLQDLSQSELANAMAWREGRIVLDGFTLAEAAARLSEVHGCAISVTREAASIRLGGSYPLNDLPRFLEALASTQAVKVRALPDGSYAIGL